MEPNDASQVIPHADDGFWSLSILEPTTSLFYETSRLWIEERYLGHSGHDNFYQVV